MVKIGKILLCFFVAILLIEGVYAEEIPNIESKYVLIYDIDTDEIVYEKNSKVKTDIASLTKMLTAITAIEKIEDLNAEVTITSDMLKGYYNASVAGLKTGDVVTYLDLLYALLLPSGADAAQILAITLSGSVANFVQDMNDLALKIGMENSHFVNTTGLDVYGHYSSASDILILLKYAFDNPTFRQVFTTKEYILTNGLVVKSTVRGYEETAEIDASRILGSKTGHTGNAGMCLASYVKIKGHDFFIITIHAPYHSDSFDNLNDHLKIIDYLDNNYEIEVSTPILPEVETPSPNKTEVKIIAYYSYNWIIIYSLGLLTDLFLIIKKGLKA